MASLGLLECRSDRFSPRSSALNAEPRAARMLDRVFRKTPKLKRSDAAARESRPALEGIAVRARFKRLTALGWPRTFPIVQFPNAPLIVAFLAGQAAAHVHGSSHAYASAVSDVALIIWAYEELVNGVNWFRHLLGLAYVISTTTHLALALQH